MASDKVSFYNAYHCLVRCVQARMSFFDLKREKFQKTKLEMIGAVPFGRSMLDRQTFGRFDNSIKRINWHEK